MEIPVAIGRTKPLSRLGPFGSNSATAHNALRFHLKQVGEVAANRDLKLKAHSLHAVVGDFDILMHATSDPSADRKPECAFWQNAAFRHFQSICRNALPRRNLSPRLTLARRLLFRPLANWLILRPNEGLGQQFAGASPAVGTIRRGWSAPSLLANQPYTACR